MANKQEQGQIHCGLARLQYVLCQLSEAACKPFPRFCFGADGNDRALKITVSSITTALQRAQSACTFQHFHRNILSCKIDRSDWMVNSYILYNKHNWRFGQALPPLLPTTEKEQTTKTISQEKSPLTAPCMQQWAAGAEERKRKRSVRSHQRVRCKYTSTSSPK